MVALVCFGLRIFGRGQHQISLIEGCAGLGEIRKLGQDLEIRRGRYGKSSRLIMRMTLIRRPTQDDYDSQVPYPSANVRPISHHPRTPDPAA